MRFFGRVFFSISVAASVLAGGKSVASTNSTADFREVYDLIRAHVPGADEATLNRAALQGILTAFRTKVQMGTNADGARPAATGPWITQARLFDDSVAYIRIARVAHGLDQEVAAAWSRLQSTNALKGIVLDLRYARGTDYAAAAAVAGLFTTRAQPLLLLENRTLTSPEKTNATRLPVAVLVNAETSGAAEALAAILRETGAGLILGERTAGEAMVMESYPLKNGDQLRIASVPIHLGDGTVLSSEGIEPDIAVSVSREDERIYYDDPYATRSPAASGSRSSATNQVSSAESPSRRGYMNEAELVREHKLGLDGEDNAPEGPTPPRRTESTRPVVKDPVLARALDLLKGLAVVQRDRF